MQSVDFYRNAFNEKLQGAVKSADPEGLYEPIRYILKLGGKRLRPVLTLMSAELFGGDFKQAMDAALGIELFHNFSLMHDDIMDDAPLRRGKTTVHEAWNINTAILSGDAMLILAYKCFDNYNPEVYKSLVKLFNQTALEVCEGQQLDMDFETRDSVSLDEYLKMISFKTAVLLAAGMKMGAITSGASEADEEGIYAFGKNLGIAFQIQDDYLDSFGDPKTFGKQLGGDIIENKKTFLFLKAAENATAEQAQELNRWFSGQLHDSAEKVQKVLELYVATKADLDTRAEIEKYTQKAFKALESLDVSEEKKSMLRHFGNNLMNRVL